MHARLLEEVHGFSLPRRPLPQTVGLRRILLVLLAGFVVPFSGCDSSRRHQSTQVNARITAWRFAQKSVQPVCTYQLEEDSALVGAGMNLMHWSPDQRALAWVERRRGDLDKCSTDSIVIRWVPDSQEVQVRIDDGRVSSFSWASSSDRIVFGQACFLQGVSNAYAAELDIKEREVSRLPLSKSGIQYPRDPIYTSNDKLILYMFDSDSLGAYDKTSEKVTRIRVGTGTVFVSRIAVVDAGIAMAEVALTDGKNSISYWRDPSSPWLDSIIIGISAIKPFRLFSTPGSDPRVLFVSYKSLEPNSAVFCLYDRITNVTDRYLDLEAAFGGSFELKEVSVSHGADYVAFSLESEDVDVCGTWLASEKGRTLFRITSYPSDGLSLSNDGKYIAYQEAPDAVCVALTEGATSSATARAMPTTIWEERRP